MHIWGQYLSPLVEFFEVKELPFQGRFEARDDVAQAVELVTRSIKVVGGSYIGSHPSKWAAISSRLPGEVRTPVGRSSATLRNGQH